MLTNFYSFETFFLMPLKDKSVIRLSIRVL